MKLSQRVWYRFLRALLSPALSRTFGLKVSGIEHIPESEPLIFVMNHVHRLDAVVIMAALPKFVCPMIAYDVVRGRPFVSLLIRLLAHSIGAVVINRHQGPKVSALKQAISKLKAGHSLLIAPEGTRGSEEKLGNFHDGAAFLALIADVKIVPVITFGYTHQSVHRIRFSQKLTVIIGEAFQLTGQSLKQSRKLATQEIRERIQSLLIEYHSTTEKGNLDA